LRIQVVSWYSNPVLAVGVYIKFDPSKYDFYFLAKPLCTLKTIKGTPPSGFLKKVIPVTYAIDVNDVVALALPLY
jgi:hypothetical protein